MAMGVDEADYRSQTSIIGSRKYWGIRCVMLEIWICSKDLDGIR